MVAPPAACPGCGLATSASCSSCSASSRSDRPLDGEPCRVAWRETHLHEEVGCVGSTSH
jgi:hypothetical protein